MDYPTPTRTTRQQDRAGLRIRANRTLLGFMGRAISRADRRLVARAYVNGAYRLSQSLAPLKCGHYSRSHGKAVVLNEAMLSWIAFGDQAQPQGEAPNDVQETPQV